MDKRQYLAQFHKFQYNRELHFAPKFKSALKHQYNQFIHAYRNGQSKHNALMAISSSGIHSLLKQLYLDAGVHYGSLVYSQLPKAPKKIKRRAPIGFNEEMVNLINAYFTDSAGWINIAEGITDTTRELIQVVLEVATEEGRDLTWIVDELSTAEDLTRNRSRLIARTETLTATNQAGFFAATKTGLLMKKEWLNAHDARVRHAHAIAGGSRVDMEDYFLVDGERLLVPGARVQENGLPTSPGNVCNCRCCAIYEAQRINGRLIEHDYHVWSAVAA